MSSYVLPTEEELSQAIEAENEVLLGRYAIAIEFARQQQEARLPELLERASNAKRDLDICKAAIKNFATTISLCQTTIRMLRRRLDF